MLSNTFRSHSHAFLIIVLLTYRIDGAKLSPFDLVVGFGDSTTDTGNVYKLTRGTWPIVPPYYRGRFTNGPVWIELLGIPTVDNYAYGGSTTDDDLIQGYTASGRQIVPGARQQIRMYWNKTKSREHDFSRTLFAIWSGNNDYFFNSTLSPSQVTRRLIVLIEDLLMIGAKHILIINKIPGQILPYVKTVDETILARERAIYHNGNLSLAVNHLQKNRPDVSIYLFDIYSLMLGIVNNNTLDLTNKTGHCWTVMSNEVLVSCANPDSYLFVDQYHCSARVHEFIGDHVRQFISSSSNNLDRLCSLSIVIFSFFCYHM